MVNRRQDTFRTGLTTVSTRSTVNAVVALIARRRGSVFGTRTGVVTRPRTGGPAIGTSPATTSVAPTPTGTRPAFTIPVVPTTATEPLRVEHGRFAHFQFFRHGPLVNLALNELFDVDNP